jgi:cyclic nucleotide-binding protein
MFFAVFLFCAQMVYVSQFFEELVVAQIYTQKANILFTNPSVYKIKSEKKVYQSGETVYQEGDKADYVYFICSGAVVETKDGIPTSFSKGDFFGEIPMFLHTARQTTAYVQGETELILIRSKKFKEIIRKNQAASAKALERVNNFTRD